METIEPDDQIPGRERSRMEDTLESIAHTAPKESSNLENGRLWVLVDGHDDFTILHARQMLNRPADAHGQVHLGRHDLPGLPDLFE